MLVRRPTSSELCLPLEQKKLAFPYFDDKRRRD
jgi:hypothetical protein